MATPFPSPPHQTPGLPKVPEQEQSQGQRGDFSTDTCRNAGLIHKAVFTLCRGHDTKETRDFPPSHVGSPRPVEATGIFHPHAAPLAQFVELLRLPEPDMLCV